MSQGTSVRRTLDAQELRNTDRAKWMRAEDVAVGQEVCFTSHTYIVEAVETDPIGRVRHRSGDDTRTTSYQPDEQLLVREP